MPSVPGRTEIHSSAFRDVRELGVISPLDVTCVGESSRELDRGEPTSEEIGSERDYAIGLVDFV